MKSRELVIKGPALGELERLLTERGELYTEAESSNQEWLAKVDANSQAIAYFMYRQMLTRINIELNEAGL